MKPEHRVSMLFFVSLFVMSPFFSVALADNPIISHKFSADPNVMEYNGRLYVYCSNDDNNNNNYDIIDYTLISSDDMVNWTDHGLVFRVPRDASWANLAFAPSCIAHNNKFYLYFPDGGSSIGVAIADRPEGPFEDPLGRSLINKSMPNCDVEWCFDPPIIIDDDGTRYLFFGGGSTGTGTNLRVIKLNEDMISVNGTAQTIEAPSSFEASFMHKREGKYYFSYATTGASKIDYLMGDNPMGPFTHKGTVLPNPVLNGQNINRNNNNHSSIIEFNDTWYIFYHDRRLSDEVYKRNVCVDRLEYDGDGTMKTVTVTAEGAPQIKNLDPYDTVQCETIDKQSGIETDDCSEGGIMVTNISEGDFTSLSGVDFGEGALRFEIRAASASGGGSVELHVGDKNGDLIGSCEITATGGWENWETFSCDVSDCSGVKDLYLVYRGSGEPYRLNWFRFEPTGTGTFSGKMQRTASPMKNSPYSSVAIRSGNVASGAGHSMFTLSGKTLSKEARGNITAKSSGVYVIRPCFP